LAILVNIVLGSLVLLVLGLARGGLHGRAATFRERVVGTMARAVVWTTGMSVTVRGPRPDPPFILVTNHLSYMDIVLIRSQLPVHFVSKAEIASWPLIGWLAALAGTLFLDRRNKRDLDRTNRMLAPLIEAGRAVAFFPEGTSGPGDRVLPFHSGLLAYPAAEGLPVWAAAITYTTPPPASASLTVCWWGDMTFVDHLYRLLRLPGFQATLSFSPQPASDSDRKRLARTLEGLVRTEFDSVQLKRQHEHQNPHHP
jgi:1-acyl-sn-glycerol-3-phosphate acyltransferase